MELPSFSGATSNAKSPGCLCCVYASQGVIANHVFCLWLTGQIGVEENGSVTVIVTSSYYSCFCCRCVRAYEGPSLCGLEPYRWRVVASASACTSGHGEAMESESPMGSGVGRLWICEAAIEILNRSNDAFVEASASRRCNCPSCRLDGAETAMAICCQSAAGCALAEANENRMSTILPFVVGASGNPSEIFHVPSEVGIGTPNGNHLCLLCALAASSTATCSSNPICSSSLSKSCSSTHCRCGCCGWGCALSQAAVGAQALACS